MSLNASCAPIRVRFGRRFIVGLTTIALLAGLVGTVTPARAQTTVLHDQYNNSAQTTTNSQNYDTVSDTYDNEAADDFEVPAGATWTIATVEVAGQYHSPNDRPSSVNVRIYRDATGLPGTSVEEWPNLQPTGGFGSPNFSNFSIPLPDAPPLGAGRYWISVQVNLVSGQHWFWRNRSATTLNPAAWRNPGGAWETPCENWGQRAATCAPSGDLAATDPDQVFRLLGASGGNQTGGPSTARNIQLCQGDVAGPGTACDTSDAFNEPGTEHEFTARVTDRRGDPVANVPVEFRETGPGVFTPQGGSTATVTTDANGLAAVILTSDVAGESSVVAEIDAGDPPTFREPGVDDDEC
ncbi:MAG TPA: Ig-like domain-containing protein, partial [Actinomycetota bacterium]|nr:Ig-like domain-containing protein [Actinomycetota bacterium]